MCVFVCEFNKSNKPVLSTVNSQCCCTVVSANISSRCKYSAGESVLTFPLPRDCLCHLTLNNACNLPRASRRLTARMSLTKTLPPPLTAARWRTAGPQDGGAAGAGAGAGAGLSQPTVTCREEWAPSAAAAAQGCRRAVTSSATVAREVAASRQLCSEPDPASWNRSRSPGRPAEAQRSNSWRGERRRG